MNNKEIDPSIIKSRTELLKMNKEQLQEILHKISIYDSIVQDILYAKTPIDELCKNHSKTG